MTSQEQIDTVSTEEPATTASAPSPRRWWALAAMMAGTFLALLDGFIVNVAAPTIRYDLGANLAEIQLVIGGYILIYGMVLVPGGRLGDIFGYRRMFILGVTLFTAASLACSMAPNPEMLILFRVLQAIGAGLFYPQVLSVLQTMFSGREQAFAFGLFGATIGIAVISGQILGGVLVGLDIFPGLGWRSIFLINVPIGVLALVVAWLTLPVGKGATRPRLDMTGTAILTVALLFLTLPLVIGREIGWPVWTLVMLVASVPAFAVFLSWEKKVAARGGDPVAAPSLFSRGAFAAGSAIALTYMAHNAGMFFVLALQLQIGLGFSALEAGLAVTPLAALFAVTSVLSPRVIARLGDRTVLVIGYVTYAVGTLVLLLTAAWLGPDITVWTFIPAFAVLGVGAGFSVTPLMGAVLRGVPERDAGAASGTLETVIQVGMTLGVAVMGLLYLSLVGTEDGTASPEAAANAFTYTALGLLVLSIVPVLLVRLLPREATTEAS